MQLIEPPPDLSQLLEEYRSQGGVVDFFLFRRRTPSSSEQISEVALAMLSALTEKFSGLYDPCWRLRVWGKPKTKEVSLEELLGPNYDLAEQCLLLRGKEAPFLNDYFGSPYTETGTDRVPIPRFGGAPWDPNEERWNGAGLAYAFSDPPYNLRMPNKRINELFQSIVRQLFVCSPDSRITRCSTDWCNYFDNGHEWWGAFLWVVDVPARGWTVGVMASSTD